MTDELVKYGNEILRTRATEYDEFNDEVRELIERMYVIMAESRGVGLAGPQIGIGKRIFTYDLGEGPHALVNPEIIRMIGEEWDVEACLSIPGLQGEVPRAKKIIMRGIDENGEKVTIKADGFMARCFQHEFDHLNGTLFIDRADPDTLETVSKKSHDDDEAEEE